MGARRFLLLVGGLQASSLVWQQVQAQRRADADRPLEGDDAVRALHDFFRSG